MHKNVIDFLNIRFDKLQISCQNFLELSIILANTIEVLKNVNKKNALLIWYSNMEKQTLKIQMVFHIRPSLE